MLQQRRLRDVCHAVESLVGEIAAVTSEVAAVCDGDHAGLGASLAETLPVGPHYDPAWRRPAEEHNSQPAVWAAGEQVWIPAQYVKLVAPAQDGLWSVTTADGRRCVLDPGLVKGPDKAERPARAATGRQRTHSGLGRRLSVPEIAVVELDDEHTLSGSTTPEGRTPRGMAPAAAAAAAAMRPPTAVTDHLTPPGVRGPDGRSATPATSPARTHPTRSQAQTEAQLSSHSSPFQQRSPRQPAAGHSPRVWHPGDDSSFGRSTMNSTARRRLLMSGQLSPSLFFRSAESGDPQGFTVADCLESPHRLGVAGALPFYSHSLGQLPCTNSDGASSPPASPARITALLMAPGDPPSDSEQFDTAASPAAAHAGTPGGSLRPRAGEEAESPLICPSGSHSMVGLTQEEVAASPPLRCAACKVASEPKLGWLRCRPCGSLLCEKCALLRVPVGVRVIHRAFDRADRGAWRFEDAQGCQRETDTQELSKADWHEWCRWVGAEQDPGVLPGHLALSYSRPEADIGKDVVAALRVRPDLCDMLPTHTVRALTKAAGVEAGLEGSSG
eukprot:TRINITY_DN1676_c0_g2_i2.p1 TRINITY_DN1676_c0_g2~~TRINITY_DN1676_c0_g2_i2.p1  ORF type:complete len:557 (+),score=104.97 TRINITY_DN1676_c0_g2_i2:103-1773(+)